MTELFTPFYKLFDGFDKEEQSHIHALITRYKILLRNEKKISTQSRRELAALEWVLTLLKELEDVDE